MTLRLIQIALLLVFSGISAAAEKTPSIRICIGSLENRSSYPLPIDKLKTGLATELSHKHFQAVNIPGQDVPGEVAANHCEYLLSGEFSNFTVKLDCDKCPVVDERKHFALQFGFALRKGAAEPPVYSHTGAVVDKNPKTCADDHIWETARFIHDYFKKSGRTSG